MIEDGVRLGEFECANIKLVGFAILGAINWMPKWYRSNGALSPRARSSKRWLNYFLRGLQPQPDATANAQR